MSLAIERALDAAASERTDRTRLKALSGCGVVRLTGKKKQNEQHTGEANCCKATDAKTSFWICCYHRHDISRQQGSDASVARPRCERPSLRGKEGKVGRHEKGKS